MAHQPNSKIDGRTVAIVGPGIMGEAILRGILNGGVVPADQVLVTHPRQERCKHLGEEYGVMASTRNADAGECDIIVVCVKPRTMPKVLQDLRGRVRPEALVISIAAGVSIQSIVDGLECRNVVRCMPNTPGSMGVGITGWSEIGIGGQLGRCACEIILALGEEIFFEDEDDLNVVTGVSGGGTVYIFMLLEAMIAAAVREGLSHADAAKLVFRTAAGSVKYAMGSGKHLAELRDQVASPGGTSAAALYEMERGGLRTIIADAVRVATERSRELGREPDRKLARELDATEE